MKLTFWGAAQTVTGSMHQLDADGRRYLLDCGMYQGHRKQAEDRNRHFPFPPRSVGAVILSQCAHRSQRKPAATGQEWIQRSDLWNACNDRSGARDAA